MICENACLTPLPHIIDSYSYSKYGCHAQQKSKESEMIHILLANLEMPPQILFVQVYTLNL